jgi:tRNA(Arg) A34 adenosine deaminase TadA
MTILQYTLQLPAWVDRFVADTMGNNMLNQPERMQLAIDLAEKNIEYGGGPFGAVVFEKDSGKIVTPGINLVLQTNNSVMHAEIVALILAQQKVGSFDLSAEGLPEYELVSSTEPCAMCLGAIPWSGIASLVCGARDEDARKIGFDEGEKPEKWQGYFRSRGIEVIGDVLRYEAAAVMQKYVDQGGIIYNGRSRMTTGQQ